MGETLVRMVLSGLLTLEDLDRPTPEWQELEEDRRRSAFSRASSGWPGRRTPAFPYQQAGTMQPWRNLAREWIAGHPRQWDALNGRPACAAEQADVAPQGAPSSAAKQGAPGSAAGQGAPGAGAMAAGGPVVDAVAQPA